MRVHVDCATSRIVDFTDEEMEWACSYLTFNDPQARFTNGNPIVELVNRIDNTFPSGFAGKLKRAGEARVMPSGRPAPINVELVDVRKPPPPRVETDLSWLRDYQRQAVETALSKTRGIVQISTGGGKTEVMAAVVASVPGNWLVLVPQADLLEQTAERIERRTGERPGIVGDGQWQPGRITVATFQTLSRRMTKAKDRAAYALVEAAHGLIVDECHTVASGTLGFVCSKAKNAYYRIGFSATPLDRSDKKSIFVIAQLGGIIHKTTSAELRSRGMLADARIRMVRVEQGSTAPTWQGVYGECVVRSKLRNQVVVEMTQQAAKPALVFVSQVKQGQQLLPAIKRAGMRAELVWGEDDTETRRNALAALVAGKLDVIVCSAVFQQAIDIPTLASVVNGAAGASIIQTLQRIGRGTRVAAGKTSFDVWDILDDGHRWLRRHGEKRKQTYAEEGYKVEVLEAHKMGVTMADPRKDEHGFTLGSAAQAAHRAAVRKEALQQLAGIDTVKNPRRGKILRPHEVVRGECVHCGAPKGNLAPECPGYRPEEAGQLL